jgi:hypothetical protein
MERDMSLEEAAEAARAHAETCINRSCHALANALEGAVLAEKWRRKRADDPPAEHTGIPPWGAVSCPRHPRGPGENR